jgi:putative ABC transport system permease protein
MTSILIGTITLILLNSYIATMEYGLKADAIEKQYGHFQIASKGYFDADETSQEHLTDFATAQTVMSEAMKMNSVSYVNIRTHLTGIIGTQKKSAVFSAIAGLPSAEALMSPTILRGSPLSESDPTGIVIGEAMAKKLEIDVGDDLIAFVSMGSGSQEAILLEIRGIYDALMPEMEKIILYMPIQSAYNLMLEKKVHRVLVFLNKTEDTENVVSSLNQFIADNNLPLETRTWDKLALMMQQVIGMFKGIVGVAGIIIFLVIIFNIQNTMYMAIHERFREIGTLRAIGSSRMEIVRSFITEGFLIGVVGAGAGIIISALLIPWLNSMNLTLPPGPGQDKPTPVYFTADVSIYFGAMMVNIFSAFVASILPAIKGSRTRIMDALRYV